MKGLTPAKVTAGMLLVVGGLITAYLAKNLMASGGPTQIPTQNIPMALAELRPGTVITESHIGMGALRVTDLQPEMLLNNRAIIGRVVKEAIPAATPVRSSQLYLPGEFPPIELAEGMRAVAVDIANDTSIANGLVRPNQYVDVYLTPNVAGSDPRLQGGMTITLFRGVRVAAINQDTQGMGPQRLGNTVTLELTPAQANIMILARNRGAVSLSYNPDGRGDGGIAVSSDNKATLDEILGLTQPFIAESYHGSARSTIRFEGGRYIDSNGSSNGGVTPDPGT